ncbi:hypothetical protein WKH57_01135 [Niallia taxi]|uniref:hypothetical protein n=1 Tax=Niallia taxi TaxID=2499688 RepID=UPI0031782CD8
MKKLTHYILRLENKSYVTFRRCGSKKSKVIETDIHYAFTFSTIEEANSYAEAINNQTKYFDKRIISDIQVNEITEITTSPKVSSRIKLKF